MYKVTYLSRNQQSLPSYDHKYNPLPLPLLPKPSLPQVTQYDLHSSHLNLYTWSNTSTNRALLPPVSLAACPHLSCSCIAQRIGTPPRLHRALPNTYSKEDTTLFFSILAHIPQHSSSSRPFYLTVHCHLQPNPARIRSRLCNPSPHLQVQSPACHTRR